MVTYGQAASSYVVLEIQADGVTGFGEASTIARWSGHHGRHYGEPPEVCRTVIEELVSPALIGENALDIEESRRRMDGVVAGYPYAKAAVEMALLDLKGKVLGIPAYELLGGPYRKRIPVMHSIGLMSTSQAVEEASQARAEGIRYIKLKAGNDAVHDLATIQAVCQELGSADQVLVDFNGGYRDTRTALLVMGALDELGVLAAEEPGRGAIALQFIRTKSRTPIVADESVWSSFDVIDLWAQRAVDGVSLYIFKAGGLRAAYAAATAAHALNLSLNINGSGELGVGNAANLHLAAVVPGLETGSVLPLSAPAGSEQTVIGGRSYVDDIITRPFAYEDGHLLVPEGPGLGIEVDMEKLERYAIS